MKQLLLTLGVSILMVGCASSVKLDTDVPVEDKTGTSISTLQGANGVSNAVSKAGVASVALDKTGPQDATQGVARVVYFDYDSYVIKPEFQGLIDTQARSIKADRLRKVAIEGHTDERGGREYNLALGQKRAEAVRSALVLLGLSDSQLEAVSFGKEKPAVQGDDENAMAKNRRAEISNR
jgi:peptidoglycan-associated lipoprotein